MLQMDPKEEKASLALVILSNDSGCFPIIFLVFLLDIFIQFLRLQIYGIFFKNNDYKSCNFAVCFLKFMSKETLAIFSAYSDAAREHFFVDGT